MKTNLITLIGIVAAAAPAVASTVPILPSDGAIELALVEASELLDGGSDSVVLVEAGSSLFGSGTGTSGGDLVIPNGESPLGPDVYLILGQPELGLSPTGGLPLAGPPQQFDDGKTDGGESGFPAPMPLPTAGLMGLAGLIGVAATRRRRD